MSDSGHNTRGRSSQLIHDLQHRIKIEEALERVRACTMAMRNSEELAQVVSQIYREFEKLDIRLSRCFIVIFEEKSYTSHWWMAHAESEMITQGVEIPFNQLRLFKAYAKGWDERKEKWQYHLKGKDKITTDQFLFVKTGLKQLPKKVKDGMKEAQSVVLTGSFYDYGGMIHGGSEELSRQSHDLLNRFSRVFNYSYARFLDIKKAEEQAREALIEAALERVRTASMAMQKSKDLKNVVSVLYKEIGPFGLATSTCTIHIFHEESQNTEVWVADGLDSDHIQSYLWYGREHPVIDLMWTKWEEKASHLDLHLKGARKKDLDEYLLTKTDYKNYPKELKKVIRSVDEVYFTCIYFEQGFIASSDFGVLNPEEKEILIRFVKVFDRAYTRFLDIQKAETQAREAQIEAALEKVRSASLAMHKSSELLSVVQVLHDQLSQFEIANHGVNIMITNETNNEIICWFSDHSNAEHLKGYSIVGRKNHVIRKIWKCWKEQNPELSIHLSGEKKKSYDNYLFTETGFSDLPQKAKGYIASHKEVYFNFSAMKYGLFQLADQHPINSENKSILFRFAKVFEQSYTRFLDLQKAETQAREAQIEAALERVRAASMAMHDSDEMGRVVAVLYQEMDTLGVADWGSNIVIADKENVNLEFWIAENREKALPLSNIRGKNHKVISEMWDAWESDDEFYTIELIGEAKVDYDNYVLNETDFKKFPEEVKKEIRSFKQVFFQVAMMQYGFITAVSTTERLSEENIPVLLRFAKVFDQSYTRFLDLQKAEAQAREAQIEAALERVRSRAMAMHKTVELSEVVAKLYKEISTLEMSALGFELILFKPDTDILEYWNNPASLDTAKCYKVPRALHPFTERQWQKWEKKQTRLVLSLKGKEKIEFDNALFQKTDFKEWPEEIKTEIKKQKSVTFSHAFMKYGFLEAIDVKPLSEKEFAILERFAKVFEQTYTRFLDLQKAESQAREALIEVALERVRSRSMAMHHSSESMDLVRVLFDQVQSVGYPIESSWITLVNTKTDTLEMWAKHGDQIADAFTVHADEHPNYRATIDAFINDVELIDIANPKVDFIAIAKESFGFDVPDRPDKAHFQLLQLKHRYGYMGLGSWAKATEEEVEVGMRFAKVFEQTYTRFLDLQKAEAQAREAQIEAALERVRAASMAMHSSDGLPEVLSVMFKQFELFNSSDEYRDIEIFIIDEHTGDAIAWTSDENFQNAVTSYPFSFHVTPGAKKEYKKWKNSPIPQRKNLIINSFYEGKSWERVLSDFDKAEELREIAMTFRKNGVTEWATHHAFFSHGMVALQQQTSLAEEDIIILQRFAQVFEQSYTRFLDLQKAEKRVREAQIEAALERVRSRAMAMHNSNELAEAAELLYSEFNNLGVTPFSCGYVINDDESREWKVWMTDSGDENFKDFWTLPFDADRHLISRYESWKKGESFHEAVLEGKINLEHHKIIAKYAPWKEAILDSLPPKLVLSCANFKNGHLLIIRDEELNAEYKQILIRFAKVFEQTYTRFLDLKTAEEQADLIKQEKERLEQTLTELKATQSQLVQSEKMASLGELTAGIAHEIQNPLNFVNNFSEVSGELIDEALEELTSEELTSTSFDSAQDRPLNEQQIGRLNEAKEILADLKGNLEKIAHHGGRASGIVKGMLDHSRASSGEKTPTDINALCDEYIRLSYHGLRAKDKSFNASFETAFDESLPKINMISQDIGRVLLNILNNAFYAVNEKKKLKNDTSYEPKVILITAPLDGMSELSPRGEKVEAQKGVNITITDNGTGMSQETINKVFQPFYTTKPTGQGTGLGMSISYDIVTKGHGGELKVQSTEGEGSTFIIRLPKNNS